MNFWRGFGVGLLLVAEDDEDAACEDATCLGFGIVSQYALTSTSPSSCEPSSRTAPAFLEGGAVTLEVIKEAGWAVLMTGGAVEKEDIF
jgi:hypothetical protein